MTDSLASKTKVHIYLGLGTQRVRIWGGMLKFLPRVGEYVVVDDTSHKVERINHCLPHGKHDREVEIYAR